MINRKELILVPAYGHKYDSKEAMIKGWVTGKDFRIITGSYCSIRDISRLKNKSTVITISQDLFNYVV